MTFFEDRKNLLPENNVKIGRILKPHANKGQISAKIFVDLHLLKTETVFVCFDNYPVPFFIDFDASNLAIDPAIIKFKNVSSIDEAKNLIRKNIFIPIKILEKKLDAITDLGNFLTGFDIFDKNSNKKLHINGFIDNKLNPLLDTSFQNKQILIPFNAIEDWEPDLTEKIAFAKIPSDIWKIY